jgi:outer membrane protein, heavy metal efflux system
MERFKIAALCMWISLQVFAQNNIDNVLTSVAKNNQALIANQQQLEAKKLQFNTGIYLNNPFLEYDYMYGSPETAGNQTDFSIAQPFDFPTVYTKRKQIAVQQVAQIDFQAAAFRQDILLDAKETCIQLIYLNKRKKELSKRLKNIESLYNSYKTKLEKGDASALDVNRIKLQLINTQTDLQLIQGEINQANHKLTQLNGGNSLSFTDTVYSSIPEIPDFKTLESTIETGDPRLKYLEKQKEIFNKEIQLSKALWLPKFEAGYHYQAILGQKFSGAHIGLAIPLWEKKNTVKYQKSQAIAGDLQIQEHRTEHYYYIQQLYEKYQQLKVSLEEYQKMLVDFNSIALLDKALALGQISLIEYSLEISNYYEAYNKFMLLEREFHSSVAQLYKFTL